MTTKVQFLGICPIDLDGFPKMSNRTFKGALHLKPKKVYELSSDEFNFIKTIRPDLRFHVFKPEKKFERPIVKKVTMPIPQTVISKTSIESKSIKTNKKKRK